MSKPCLDHMAATKRMLRHVKGTIRYGLGYKSEKEC